MPNDKPRPVLMTFMEMDDRAAAREYLQRETQRMAQPLHDMANFYSRVDWPLLVATMENFAAGILSTLSDEGKDLAASLRKAQGVVVFDLDAIRRGMETQKGEQ